MSMRTPAPVEADAVRIVAPLAARPAHCPEIRQILRWPRVQSKLKVGPANDQFEREADRVADRVLQNSNEGLRGRTPGQHFDATTFFSAEESRMTTTKGMLMAKAEPGRTRSPRGNPLAGLGNGRPLLGPVRAFFETRFGADFSGVRMHDGASAEVMARDMNACAFAFGNHIVFGPNRFQPTTIGGRRLIAHELAHTLQQGFDSSAPDNDDTP